MPGGVAPKNRFVGIGLLPAICTVLCAMVPGVYMTATALHFRGVGVIKDNAFTEVLGNVFQSSNPLDKLSIVAVDPFVAQAITRARRK